MQYTPKNYSALLGMEGFSEQLLKNHFKLYEGYVTNTNKLNEIFATLPKDRVEYAELKRRYGWEFNGMRLHELYFGNMVKGGSTLDPTTPLAEKLSADFGSLENWRADFKATSTVRGIGWTILYEDPESGACANVWINEHDLGHLAGGKPLLVLDVFEHAYMIDYGLNRAEYVNAFMNVVNWNVVTERHVTGTKT